MENEEYWDAMVQAADREEDERVAAFKLTRDELLQIDWALSRPARTLPLLRAMLAKADPFID